MSTTFTLFFALCKKAGNRQSCKKVAVALIGVRTALRRLIWHGIYHLTLACRGRFCVDALACVF
jgi:hypothetical protein